MLTGVLFGTALATCAGWAGRMSTAKSHARVSVTKLLTPLLQLSQSSSLSPVGLTDLCLMSVVGADVVC